MAVDSFSTFLDYLQDGVADGDAAVIGIIVAVFVVILTILIFACRGGANKRRGVLLVGLCDSGKTLIYSRLVNGKFVNTQTSIKENLGDYSIKGDKERSLRVIDLPGHERLRSTLLEQYKPLARGIVFVIDSLTFQKEVKDAAEFLYILLTDKVVNQNSPPVLVLCNKHDQALAKGAKVIQSLLEKEINTLRITQSAALDATDKVANNNAFLGKRGSDFRFEHLGAIKVDFAESSARGSRQEAKADLDMLENWLMKIA